MKKVPQLLTYLAVAAIAGWSGPASAAFVIESLDGDITPNEIRNFVTTASGFSVSTSNLGNAMADHASGVNVEGIRKMYEATGDVSILNLLVKHVDIFLAHKNDEPLGEHRVMWDGNIEPVWPSQAAPSGYAGSENGQVAGHIAYAAWLILKTPSLWSQTIPDGDPHGYGATYLARAKTYVAKIDDALGRYFTVWFIDPTTHRVHEPTDPRWVACCKGADTAWNRQMMYTMPYLFSAASHDILHDNPSFLALYKDVVDQFATWFVDSGTYYTSGGRKVVKWFYEVPPDMHIENIGHAQHDVVGLVQSYESGYTTLALADVQPFADTTQFVINLGTIDTWADNVDGTGAQTASLKTDFIFLAKWNRALYKMIAQSNIDDKIIASGSESCKNTGYILYMKHWLNGGGDAGSGVDASVGPDAGRSDGGGPGMADGNASSDSDTSGGGDTGGGPSRRDDADLNDASSVIDSEPRADTGSLEDASVGGDRGGPTASASPGGCSCDIARRSSCCAPWLGIGLLVVGVGRRRRASGGPSRPGRDVVKT
jgi:hypothetical protein